MHEMTLTRDDETEVTVAYTTTPIIPASGPSWNDPGSPAEGGEVELHDITDSEGDPVKCTDAELERFEREIGERHDFGEPDYDYDERD